ncbi:MAG: NERD domain-containing protein [Pseudomonadota bacterium]
MSDFGLVVAAVSVAVVLIAVALYRRFHKGDRLTQLFRAIGHARIDALVIPNGDDGEIQIDHLLLTSKGLLLLNIKEVAGSVFGSDKMSDWTVIAPERRYTFSNPQPGLYDRVAAVRQIVKDVPVEGRVLFLDGATFSKGVPAMVTTIDELRAEYEEADAAAAGRKVEAFKPFWETLQAAAVSGKWS